MTVPTRGEVTTNTRDIRKHVLKPKRQHVTWKYTWQNHIKKPNTRDMKKTRTKIRNATCDTEIHVTISHEKTQIDQSTV